MVDTVAQISGWIQIALTLGLLYFAQRLANQFAALIAWRFIWIAFAVGFAGILEARIIVILLAYDVEPSWLQWGYRFMVPLQANLGLFVGMLLIYRFLTRLAGLNSLIHLPHPAGFVVDAESRVLAWDAGAEVLFGCTAAEAMGKTLMELITPPHILSTHVPIVERYLRTGTTSGLSQRYTITARACRTQEEFPAEVILTAETGANGAMQFKGISRKLIPSN